MVGIRKFTKLSSIFCMVLLVAGCLYRPDLLQGNYITQTNLNKLRPGMAKVQVAQIMGTPALTPVLEIEDWHYTYAYRDGMHRQKPLCFETIDLHFKEDRLQSYSSTHWHPENLPRK